MKKVLLGILICGAIYVNGYLDVKLEASEIIPFSESQPKPFS